MGEQIEPHDDGDGFYGRDDDTLVQYTICELPPDFPKHYVVRRVEVHKEGKLVITKFYRLGRTLQEARAHLPPGMYPLARDPTDPLTVMETWT